MNDNAKIYIQDLRYYKHCLKGARKFFKENGLNWSDFLKNGIEASKLEDISNDVMVERIVKYARNKKRD